MAETLPRPDLQTPPSYPDYGALPFNLENLGSGKDYYVDYMTHSMEGIREQARVARERCEVTGWAPPGLVGGVLSEMIEIVLIDSHNTGLMRNRIQREVGDLLMPHDERHEKALRGQASPAELLALLEDYPAIGSIELAKLHHPLDVLAAKGMDADMEEALGGERKAAAGLPRYKMKFPVPELPAATVLRKETLGDYRAAGGRIHVIRRETLLVRGDEGTDSRDPGLAAKVAYSHLSDEYFRKLTEKIEGYYPHLEEQPDLRWLQPLVTSYYATYVPEEA